MFNTFRSSMKLRNLSNSLLLLLGFFAYVKPVADLPSFNKIVAKYKNALDYNRDADKAILAPQLLKLYDDLLHINADCNTTLEGHRLNINNIRKLYSPKVNNDKFLAEQNRLKLLEEQRLMQAHQAFLAQERQRAEQERLNSLAQEQARLQQEAHAAHLAQERQRQETAKLSERQRLEREEAQRAQAKLSESIVAEQERQKQLKAVEDKMLAEKQRLDAEKARLAQELKAAQDTSNKELQEKLRVQELIAKDLENKLASERANLASEKTKSEQLLRQQELRRKELADKLKIAEDRLVHERSAIASMNLKSNPHESLNKAIASSDIKQVEFILAQYKPNKAQKEDLLKLSQDAIAKRSSERLTGLFNGNTLAGGSLLAGSIVSNNYNKVEDFVVRNPFSEISKEVNDLYFKKLFMNDGVTPKPGVKVNEGLIGEVNTNMTKLKDSLEKSANDPQAPVDPKNFQFMQNKVTHINYLNMALGGLGVYYIYKGFKQAWEKYNKAREIRDILIKYQYAE